MKIIMGMRASILSTWDVINIKNPSYIKRNMVIPFNEGQVTPVIFDFWQINQLALIQMSHWFSDSPELNFSDWERHDAF